jgi:peptide/nickel transport system substrate-binding protein
VRTRVAALLAPSVGALVAAACDPASATLHRRRDPGALIVAQPADIVSLDLARVTDSESIEVAQEIFDGLVRWKPGTTDVVPGVATWQVDGKRWTFFLRDGVKFHDGTTLDAAAVVFSFERLLDPNHPYYLGDAGDYWRSVLKDVQRVVAIDDRTVEIDVARPYAPLLGDLAIFPIVSPTAVARFGNDFQNHPIGSGPYAFESWSPGEQVVLHRFDDYWDGPAGLERIVFEVVGDARQRLVDLEAGSVDLATSLLPDELPFVELHPDLALHHAAGNDVSYLAFNLDHPPFDDVRVRQAANYAINKEPIVKLAFQGRATAADGPLPPSQWGYHEAAVRYGYDVERARQLIAAAVADGKLDPTRTYKLYAPTTPRLYMSQPERVARFLQAGLESVGLHTELVLQPYQQHRAAVERGEHDLCLFGWIGDTGDPDDFLYPLFDRDNAQPGEAQNVAFYRDPHVHDLLLAAQGATDPSTRERLYAEAQDKIAADAPWVPIAHGELIVAGRAELANVIVTPTGSPVYALIHRAEPH